MSDHTSPDLWDKIWTGSGLLLSAWMAKLSHRYAKSAKQAAEMTAVHAELADHTERIEALERAHERDHRTVLQNIDRSSEELQRSFDKSIADLRRTLTAEIRAIR